MEFQYIHVTINQANFGCGVFCNAGFNTSMLLLIGTSSHGGRVIASVSIHPCYY